MKESYKCEHSKFQKNYLFFLKKIIYNININLENKRIVSISKKHNNFQEKLLITDEKQIYKEIIIIKNYLENKLRNLM